jgi:hypothetical protein
VKRTEVCSDKKEDENMAYVFMLLTIGLALLFLVGEVVRQLIEAGYCWAVEKVKKHKGTEN